MPAEAAPRIVDVGPERHAECLRVLNEAFATETAQFGITRENTPSNPAFWGPADLARVVARPADLFAVADPSILGCAFALASRSRPGTWELRHLAVAPDARNRGHGEALVAEAARRARAAGGQRLRIGIVAQNLRLSLWYRRLGFASLDVTSYPGLLFDVEHLELSL